MAASSTAGMVRPSPSRTPAVPAGDDEARRPESGREVSGQGIGVYVEQLSRRARSDAGDDRDVAGRAQIEDEPRTGLAHRLPDEAEVHALPVRGAVPGWRAARSPSVRRRP